MSLTKKDLQAIGDLIDSSFDRKFDSSFSKNFDPAFDRKFDSSFSKNFDPAFDRKFDEKFFPVKKTLRKIQNDVNTMIDFFNREHLGLRKRVDRIENHLNLSKIS